MLFIIGIVLSGLGAWGLLGNLRSFDELKVKAMSKGFSDREAHSIVAAGKSLGSLVSVASLIVGLFLIFG